MLGDPCSAACLLEGAGFNCTDAGAGFQTVCVPSGVPVCGDALRTINELCDDGNTAAGDGCSADCSTVDAVVYNHLLPLVFLVLQPVLIQYRQHQKYSFPPYLSFSFFGNFAQRQ